MAGILDSKSRVLDIVITSEGKRQIAAGKLIPRFISFSDGRSFYESDAVSGSSDASDRIYFEAFSQKRDIITLESDDSGQLVRYDGGPLTLNSDALFTRVFSGTRKGENILVSGSAEFASLSRDLLSGTLKNFNKLDVIGDEIPDVEDEEFRLTKDRIDLNISQFTPIKSTEKTSAYVDEIEPLFLDKRIGHVVNFAFLPPTNAPLPTRRSSGRPVRTPLGQYSDLRQFPNMGFNDILDELQGRSKKSHGRSVKKNGSAKPVDVIQFDNTSEDNNLVIQIFESNGNQSTLKKLDIINFGEFRTNGFKKSSQSVYFAGKIFLTKTGIPTFVNIFTIVID
jgi:hypothetical protein